MKHDRSYIMENIFRRANNYILVKITLRHEDKNKKMHKKQGGSYPSEGDV